MIDQKSETRVPQSALDMEHELTRAVARLQAGVMALVFGLICGVGLFAMTAILVIEAGPNTGVHLCLLDNYFIGYSVTWPGAFVGFLWAFVLGSAVGWTLGYVYNRVVGLRQGVKR